MGNKLNVEGQKVTTEQLGSDEIAIKVSNVSKTFKLPHEKNSSIKSIILNPLKKRTYEKQEVLKNISFDIKKGEFFGIVGRNGSGKSTLLKLLAGIYSPDKGHIQVNGKLTPFIELGVGFNPELTGRENVFLNGALLGFNRKEMSAMYNEIVEFAELEKFMDQKLKNYSSGMQVRLAFSIAIRANTEILLLDEVLAVGDAAFQQKCYDYFDYLRAGKKTVVLVTHDMNAVRDFCDKALLINKGKVVMVDKAEDTALEYEKLNLNITQTTSALVKNSIETSFEDENGNKIDNIQYKSKARLNINWDKHTERHKVNTVGFILKKGDEVVFATNTIGIKLKAKSYSVSFDFPNLDLGKGRYKISIGLFGNSRNKIIDFFNDSVKFSVYGQPLTDDKGVEWLGITKVDGEWKL